MTSIRSLLRSVSFGLLAFSLVACEVPDPGVGETLKGSVSTPANPIATVQYGSSSELSGQLYGPASGTAVGVFVQLTVTDDPSRVPLDAVSDAVSKTWDVLVVDVDEGAAGLAEVSAAAAWARQRAGRRPVVLAGEEFAATYAARHALAQPTNVNAAVLLRPVTGPTGLDAAMTQRWASVTLDAATATALTTRSMPHDRAVPVYIAHGTTDSTIAYSASRAMYDKWRTAGDERAWFDTVEAQPGDVSLSLNMAALTEFLARVATNKFPPSNGDAPAKGQTRVYTVGDSLTVGAIGAGYRTKLAAAGYTGRDSAVTGRSTTTGLSILQTEVAAGRLEPVVIVALGTNDLYHSTDLAQSTVWFGQMVDKVMATVGPKRHVVWVNLQLKFEPKRSRAVAFNKVLAAKDVQYSNMTVGNWYQDGPWDAFTTDGVHYLYRGNQARADAYVTYLRWVTGRH